jgi:hypothetical protein
MDENLEKNIEQEELLKKVREEVLKRLGEYRKSISYLACDAPISVLCLPKTIENILIDQGWLRIYDLFDRDFTEIEGLTDVRLRNLTARLDQFFSML